MPANSATYRAIADAENLPYTDSAKRTGATSAVNAQNDQRVIEIAQKYETLKFHSARNKTSPREAVAVYFFHKGSLLAGAETKTSAHCFQEPSIP